MTAPALSPAKIAEELDVSTRTIEKLINAGDLPGFRVGRQMRVRRTDLDAYITANATGPQR